MKGILNVKQLPNGAYQNQLGQFETIPDGWAVIPDGMELPATFPFVNIEAEEITHYRDVMVEREVTKTREVEQYREVTKTVEVPQYDEEGNPVLDGEGNPVMVTEEYVDMEPYTVTEEYTEMEMVTEQEPYTVMTVTSMTEGVMPEPGPEWPEPQSEPSVWDELDAAYQEGVNGAYDQ